MGADGIEVDVHLHEGELFVIHDSTLDRTTSGSGALRHCSLEQLRTLDAGEGERIPLLREVLDTINARALLNIELKGRRTAGPVLALLEEAVRGGGWSPEDFLLSSFHRSELRQLPGRGFPIGILYPRSARLFQGLARALGAWSINVPLPHVSPHLVARAHRDGRKILVYTVNSRADMDRVAEWGVDGIITDFPDRWTGR